MEREFPLLERDAGVQLDRELVIHPHGFANFTHTLPRPELDGHAGMHDDYGLGRAGKLKPHEFETIILPHQPDSINVMIPDFSHAGR